MATPFLSGFVSGSNTVFGLLDAINTRADKQRKRLWEMEDRDYTVDKLRPDADRERDLRLRDLKSQVEYNEDMRPLQLGDFTRRLEDAQIKREWDVEDRRYTVDKLRPDADRERDLRLQDLKSQVEYNKDLRPLQLSVNRDNRDYTNWTRGEVKRTHYESLHDKERARAASLYQQALELDKAGQPEDALDLLSQADAMSGGYYSNLASGKYSQFARIAGEVRAGARKEDDPEYRRMLNEVMQPTLRMSGRSGRFSVDGLDDIGDGRYAVRLKKEFGGAFADTIRMAASRFGIDPDLVAAVIRQESMGKAGAVSNKGAGGLMQLMPETYKEVARKLNLGGDRFDPVNNIVAGTYYLKQMLDRFGGNIPKALAAYNAGAGAVEKYNGIPPYKETQNYVPKILKNYHEIKRSYPATRGRSSDNTDPVSIVTESDLGVLTSAEEEMRNTLSPDLQKALKQRLAQYGGLTATEKGKGSGKRYMGAGSGRVFDTETGKFISDEKDKGLSDILGDSADPLSNYIDETLSDKTLDERMSLYRQYAGDDPMAGIDALKGDNYRAGVSEWLSDALEPLVASGDLDVDDVADLIDEITESNMGESEAQELVRRRVSSLLKQRDK